MKNLWWKQWHENKRYLAAFMAWMALGAGYAIAYQMAHKFRAPVGQFSSIASFYAICAAVILSVRAARGEYADGTHSFSAALPVSMRRIATVRILGASATMVLPILAAAVIMSAALFGGFIEQVVPRVADSYVSLPQRGTATQAAALGQLWGVTAIASCAGLELLLLLSLAGCWLRNQSQIGLVGAVAAFGSVLASGLFWMSQHRNAIAQLIYGACLPQSLVVHWGYGIQSGHYVDHEMVRFHWISLGLAVPLLVFIGHLFVSRYGSFRNTGLSPASRPIGDRIPASWLRLPFRQPRRLTTLFWSELSQSLPLASAGLLLACLMSIAEVLLDGRRGGYTLGTTLLMNLPHSTWAVGTLWAIVVGSGLYAAELAPGLGNFWRSRPISPGQWFWSKFLIGLIAVVGVLDGVTVLLSWASPRNSMTTGMSWAYVGCMPIGHSFLYALAVLGTCWLRKPVIGGFLALAGYAILTVMLGAFGATSSFEPISVYNELLQAERAGNMDFTRHGYPLVYGTLALMIVLIAILSCRLAKPLQPKPIGFGLSEKT